MWLSIVIVYYICFRCAISHAVYNLVTFLFLSSFCALYLTIEIEVSKTSDKIQNVNILLCLSYVNFNAADLTEKIMTI